MSAPKLEFHEKQPLTHARAHSQVSMRDKMDDRRHLLALQGYWELGLYPEAMEEIACLNAGRSTREYLALGVQVRRLAEEPERACVYAGRLIFAMEPDGPARFLNWARRRIDGDTGWIILLLLFDHFPGEDPDALLLIAHWYCRHGELKAGREMLMRALNADSSIKAKALADSVLEPLWHLLGEE